MELSTLIFFLGSLLGYYPIYRALVRVLHRSGRQQRRGMHPRPVTSSKQQFLASLRHEAAGRARSTAQASVSAATRNGRASVGEPLDAAALSRLAETGHLVRTLLATDAAAAFDDLASALRAPASSTPEWLDALLMRLDRALSEPAPAPPAVRRSAVARPWTLGFGASTVAGAANPA